MTHHLWHYRNSSGKKKTKKKNYCSSRERTEIPVHPSIHRNSKEKKMQLPPATATASTTIADSNSNSRPSVVSTTATYTTIPIVGGDVVSRSINNLSSFLSLCRPWPEFIATGVFDRPESLSLVGDRLRRNANYFRLNYGLLIFTCALLSLLGTPFSLLVIAAVSALWLILYIFREDPLVLWDHHLSDRVVLVGLTSASIAALWLTGSFENLIFGLGTGMLISAIHGAFRNPDGLFLSEDEAASSGLIGTRQQQQQQQQVSNRKI